MAWEVSLLAVLEIAFPADFWPVVAATELLLS